MAHHDFYDGLVKVSLGYPEISLPARLYGKSMGVLEQDLPHLATGNGSERYLRVAGYLSMLGSSIFISHPCMSLLRDWAHATHTTIGFIGLNQSAKGTYEGVSPSRKSMYSLTLTI